MSVQGRSPQAERQRLLEVLRARSVKRQKVVLASGKESDFYVDARLTTLDPEGADLIANLVLDRLLPEVEAIGGPVTGADPIVDRAIALNPALEAFLGQDQNDVTRLADSFDRLETILNQGMVQ